MTVYLVYFIHQKKKDLCQAAYEKALPQTPSRILRLYVLADGSSSNLCLKESSPNVHTYILHVRFTQRELASAAFMIYQSF